MHATDRLEILELLPRYAAAFDQGQLDALVDLFAEDASFEVHGRIGDMPSRIEGRAAIVAHMRRRHAEVQPTQRRHVMANQWVEAGPHADAAVVHAYLILCTTTAGALSVLLTGRYASGVVRRGGRWSLQRHVLHLDASLG